MLAQKPKEMIVKVLRYDYTTHNTHTDTLIHAYSSEHITHKKKNSTENAHVGSLTVVSNKIFFFCNIFLFILCLATVLAVASILIHDLNITNAFILTLNTLLLLFPILLWFFIFFVKSSFNIAV